DLLRQGADQIGLGDRPRLDENAPELAARLGLGGEGRVELGRGQEALAQQQRAERRSFGHSASSGPHPVSAEKGQACTAGWPDRGGYSFRAEKSRRSAPRSCGTSEAPSSPAGASA